MYLKDIAIETHDYTDVTADLHSRFAQQNARKVPHTSKFKPRHIETKIAFSSKVKAYAFEAYLKTHCGRTFAKRNF